MKGFILTTSFLLSLQHTVCAEQISGAAAIWGRHNFPYITSGTRFAFVEGGINVTYALTTNGQLHFWGDGYNLPYLPVPDTNSYVAVAGSEHNLIGLRGDGKVVAIGSESSVPSNLTNVVAISASQSHCMALRDDGTVWDESGAIPAVSGVSAIAAGNNLSVVLFSNGTAQAWSGGSTYDDFPYQLTNVVGITAGSEQVGLLRGDGTVAVWGGDDAPAGLTNVVSLVSGETHFLALKSDGTVQSWGWSWDYDETVVPPGLSNVVQIATGANHNLALRADGSIAAWNGNLYGQSLTPDQMQKVVSVAAGAGFSILVKDDGSVMAIGQMGDYEEKAWVPAGLTNVLKAAAGYHHALALKSDGTVSAWGRNTSGQCAVPATLDNVTAIAAGEYFSAALKSDGTVVTWGGLSSEVPKPVGLTDVISIAAGSDHVVALKRDGTVVAWGANWDDQCYLPESMEKVVDVAAGFGVSLARYENGEVEPWGGVFSLENPPPRIGNVVRMTVGSFVTVSGEIHWWGLDASETFVARPETLFWVSDAATGFDNHVVIVSEPTAPFFVQEPEASNNAFLGEAATLDCIAEGPQPFTYQWQKNEINISGATNRTITLEPVQQADSGYYRVIVGNAYGTATSGPVCLSVQVRPPLELALGTTLFWQTGGNARWSVQTNDTLDGYSVRSGAIQADEESWIETIVYGPGVLRYSWKVSAEENYDGIELLINGSSQNAVYGSKGWQAEEHPVSEEGKVVVRWRFFNDSADTGGDNAAWLDSVTFTPGFSAEPFSVRSSLSGAELSFQIERSVEDEEEILPARGYVLQSSANLVDWLSVTNFSSEETLLLTAPAQGDQGLFYRAITP